MVLAKLKLQNIRYPSKEGFKTGNKHVYAKRCNKSFFWNVQIDRKVSETEELLGCLGTRLKIATKLTFYFKILLIRFIRIKSRAIAREQQLYFSNP